MSPQKRSGPSPTEKPKKKKKKDRRKERPGRSRIIPDSTDEESDENDKELQDLLKDTSSGKKKDTSHGVQ